jgi:GntR family transcriptional regulator
VRDGIPDDGPIPLYYSVKVLLLRMITDWPEGEFLPGERELSTQWGVSRVTVRQAVSELVLEGRLTRRQGRGTYVTPPKLVQPFSPTNQTGDTRDGDAILDWRLISSERMPACAQLATDLRIDTIDEVLHIERVLFVGYERIGLESAYLHAARFPKLLEVFDPGQSLHTCLRVHFDVRMTRSEERVETVLSTPREAGLIGTTPAAPMLLKNRISQDQQGKPFERVRSVYRGDRLSFVTDIDHTTELATRAEAGR